MKRVKLAALGIAAAAALGSTPAMAQDFYMGETMLVGFGFCPTGTLEANGSLLAISQYNALFALLGTTYGGDGIRTFALPDLRGRNPIGQGNSPQFGQFDQGEESGTEQVTLLSSNLPAHTHSGNLVATTAPPTVDNPAGAILGDFPPDSPIYNNQVAPNVDMQFNSVALQPAGNNAPVAIRDPYLPLRYCIVVDGIYPSQP